MTSKWCRYDVVAWLDVNKMSIWCHVPIGFALSWQVKIVCWLCTCNEEREIKINTDDKWFDKWVNSDEYWYPDTDITIKYLNNSEQSKVVK